MPMCDPASVNGFHTFCQLQRDRQERREVKTPCWNRHLQHHRTEILLHKCQAMIMGFKRMIVNDMTLIDGTADGEFVAQPVEILRRGELLRRDLDDDWSLVRKPTRPKNR